MQPDFFAVVAAVLAVVLLVDISVLWLTGRQVPELLAQLIFGVFGFYFGRAPGVARRGNGVVAPLDGSVRRGNGVASPHNGLARRQMARRRRREVAGQRADRRR